jgi:LysM repeat protein
MIFWLLFSYGCSKPEKKEIEDVYIPEVLTFAGDTIPIHDPDIRERLEKELLINQHWTSSTSLWIKKSGRWSPMIDSILKKNQIPEDFRYLVAIESGFDNVTSNKGAVGFWQLMEPTAREFGLRIDEEADERLNPEKSTEAACKLIARGKLVLGKWPETAVSYNIGITGLKSVMAGQYTDSFYDLLINPESGRYLFRILAAKLILSMPDKYGYSNLTPYESFSSREQVLSETIADLPYWCRQNGFSYKCFRLLNPWIRTNRISILDSLGPVKVKIPTNCTQFTQLPKPELPQPDSVASQTDNVFRNLVNQKDIKSLKEESLPKQTEPEFHEIGPGENLGLIVRKYDLSMADLFRLNPGLEKRQNKIQKGQKLRIREESK